MRHLLAPALLAALGTLPLAAADTYGVDASHSAALFSVSHLGISNTHGRFNAIDGTLTWDAAEPAKPAEKKAKKDKHKDDQDNDKAKAESKADDEDDHAGDPHRDQDR